VNLTKGEQNERKWFALKAALIMTILVGSAVTARTGRAQTGDTGQVSFTNGFAPVAKNVLPAVVNIASSKTIRFSDQGSQSPLFSDPFFRQFFGDGSSSRVPREQRERSLGSGVIVNADGYILTNSHVVAGADEITISLGDKREFKGRVVGPDHIEDCEDFIQTDAAVNPGNSAGI
jgi:S1-C subfamily serine protease